MLLSPVADAVIAGVFGLLVGSFLNVVIYRLPKMLERQWAAECAQMQGQEAADAGPPFNLVTPRSRCRQCAHMIRWYENIPLVSYAVLRGKCSNCGTPIGLRYPIVEAATGGLFAFCIAHWGLGLEGVAWCVFSAAILALALIDWDTTLLPDDITQPLLWGGLIVAALGWTRLPLSTAVWGAVWGYMSLWIVYQAFRLLTGKEGMGYGDFKLFAALGAWFGWQALVPIILMASVIGAAIGIVMKLSDALREGRYVPFGPFLALAGLTGMIFGPGAILGVLGVRY
ncbi:MAG TPA: A24 family peptidase [Ramlibacter sp.]|uniref:prepilin peptidase n=1 Tax=Ramlibacter sp. TaxID=1917967 RepID=UPI002C0E83B4|nr:A24 family peptidase [Ramlibacter sp.]HVZ43284.1 A24 family peptidase [Ramlibacter sp.]